MSCMSTNSTRAGVWWFLALLAALTVLLVIWATRAVHVAPVTLLTIGAVAIALSWLVVLVRTPWNLYFAARRAALQTAASRERGIVVRPAVDSEARRISRWMLWLALGGGHLGTALAAAAIAFFSGDKAGYYVAGIFLLSTTFRPASAFMSHVRQRITTLSRESTLPAEDAASLRAGLQEVTRDFQALRAEAQGAAEELHRTEARLTDAIAHNRALVMTDLERLKAGLEAVRTQSRQRGDDLEHKVDQLVRRVEATLDGISDHGELAAGLRALVRMIRSESA